ncbi:chemotaxis protein CheX [Aurantivibrio plasticivorans]
MFEDTLQVFIQGVLRYFEHTNDRDVKVGTPYLTENTKPAAYDLSGIIGIAGNNRGCVYFTAPRILLKHLLMSIGESDTSDANLIDLVGEVANTISGNARSEFGHEFMISVPVMLEGAPGGIHLPQDMRSYVIPIYWKSYHAAVVICLENN